MNKEFEFTQLLRAYRAGIISESAFEAEMDHLGIRSNGNGAGFKAFGRTYASEREAVIKFLEAVAPAETAGGEAIRAWLEACKLDRIKGGLTIAAERQSNHERAYTQPMTDMDGTVPKKA